MLQKEVEKSNMHEKKAFTNYVNAYKKLPIEKKKEYLLEETKKTLAYAEFVKSELNIEGNILFNREILDYKSGETTEEDLIEAMFVYIISIRENFAETFNKILDKK